MLHRGLLQFVFIIAVLALGVYVYVDQRHLKNDVVEHSAQLSCIVQRTGTVNMKMYYPSAFRMSEQMARDGRVFLYGSNGADLVLSIDWYPGYLPLNSLLNTNNSEPGPVYQIGTFNGHEAAYLQGDSTTEGLWQYYKVPYGNRVLEILYRPPQHTTEKTLAEQMLRGIELSLVNEDTKEGTVENCAN